MELTQQERNAIYLVRACANGDNLSDFERILILLIGSKQKVETERGTYTLIKFFGKLYYIA